MSHRRWLYRCCLSMMLLSSFAFAACDDEETQTNTDNDTGASDSSSGTDATVGTDTGTGTGTTTDNDTSGGTTDNDTSGGTDTDTITPPQCSETTPICDTACPTGQLCGFDGIDCLCVCNVTAPGCAGGGPNNGCAADELCNTSCECVPNDVCNPDDPVCTPACGAGTFCECSGDNAICSPDPIDTPDLDRPSRSTAVDISADDSTVVMVNSDDGTVSIFDVATAGDETQSGAPVRTSLISQASEPHAVVIHPDGARAFVANRATGSVSRIIGINTANPSLDEESRVGAEPVGLALSPSGDLLFVTDWVDGTVSVIDTDTMAVTDTIDVGGNPYAIAITNNLDGNDTDEKAYVTQFFGQARPGATQVEATDDGKEGVVHVISLNTLTVTSDIKLAPVANCFVNTAQTSGCYPNQLFSVTFHTAFGKTRAYVLSSAAAPVGPPNFSHNIQALLSVIDVATDTELPALTVNLNNLVKAQVDADGDNNVGRRFLNTPSGIDFLNRDTSAVAYVSAAASDIVFRLQWDDADVLVGGSPIALNITVGQNPQGIVLKHGTSAPTAYTANLVSRDLSVLSLSDQRQTKVVEATPKPTAGSPDFDAWKGKRFFNTSTAIWSNEGWGSCQGCHFLGLTDNVTFKFPAGPRQSISLDGQFASDDPTDMRALNWTAIFDESHDFELNVRGVSGGKGTYQRADGSVIVSPVTTPPTPPLANILIDGTNSENHQALNGSTTFISNDPTICANPNTCPDFNQVDEYIQTIRSPNGKSAEQALIDQGRQIFADGGCDKCHAGPKWTISRTFYDPATSNGAPPTRVFTANAAASAAMDPATLTSAGALPTGVNTDTTLIAGDDSGGGTPALKRQACNIRSVGTFNASGGADETRENGTPAQGAKGYNPPSLLGLSLGAPYLHNGAAVDLQDLFARFDGHTQAGSGLFEPSQAEVDALIAFLLSIDEDTTPFAIRAGTTLCPDDFTP